MNYLSVVIVFVVVSVLMKYLGDSSKKNPVINEEGTIILKMNKTYGIIGYIGIGFSAVIGIVASIGAVKSIEDLFIVIGLVAFFLVVGALLVLVSKKMNVRVDDERINYLGITGKTKEIMWNDIKEVSFSKSMLELSLKTNTTKIKLHMHLIGFSTFIEKMKSKTDYSIHKDAIHELESLGV